MKLQIYSILNSVEYNFGILTKIKSSFKLISTLIFIFYILNIKKWLNKKQIRKSSFNILKNKKFVVKVAFYPTLECK